MTPFRSASPDVTMEVLELVTDGDIAGWPVHLIGHPPQRLAQHPANGWRPWMMLDRATSRLSVPPRDPY